MSYESDGKKTTVLSDTQTPVLLSCVMIPKSTQALMVLLGDSRLKMLVDIVGEAIPVVAYNVLVDRKAIPHSDTFREFMFVDLFTSHLLTNDINIFDVFSRNLIDPDDAINKLRDRGFKI